MQKALLAITVAALSMGALATADAKGNGGAEQREKLQAALAEARAQNGDTDTGGGFFSSLFGGSETEDRAKDADPQGDQGQSSN